MARFHCGDELHGVEYVEELWATLWGIWQHCEPQRPDKALLKHYVRMQGKGSAKERGFDMLASAGYGGEPDHPEEIVVNPEAMPPLPWEKRKRRSGD